MTEEKVLTLAVRLCRAVSPDCVRYISLKTRCKVNKSVNEVTLLVVIRYILSISKAAYVIPINLYSDTIISSVQ